MTEQQHSRRAERERVHPHAAAGTEAEERLRAILETAVEGIITIDERGIIESVNPAAEKIFGYSATELAGQNVSLLMPSPDRERHDEYLANYLRTGQARIIGIGREVLGRRKDGAVFPMDLSVSEVRLSRGRVFTGFIRDISERRRAEVKQAISYATTRALAESESLEEAAPRFLQTVCENTGWSVGELWVLDAEANALRHAGSGRISSIKAAEFNGGVRQLSFARGEGLPGRVWATGQPLWIDEAGTEPAMVRLSAAAREDLHAAFACPILLTGAVEGVMLFFSREALRPDQGLVSVLQDMGSQIAQYIQRKRAQQKLKQAVESLAEKNKELETIVYIASHDLRSPLVNIQGFSKELARACQRLRALRGEPESTKGTEEVQTILEEDIPESLSYIEAGVSRIDALLSGFLRYSRLGRAALKMQRLNMNSLLAKIAESMEFQLKQAQMSLQVANLPEGLGDATQITQVFSNLLDNAIKYRDRTRPGMIKVTGRVEAGFSVYAVHDNGTGIPAEHQHKIFEIFHRLNPTQVEGEGLGLSIAQRILERHNGKIRVESQPGTGSTFFISLPRPETARVGE